MKKIVFGIKAVFYYVVGNIIAFFKYDRKYLKSRWFYSSKWLGVGNSGWRWILKDLQSSKIHVVKKVPWPVSPLCTIIGEGNIYFHPDDLNNFQSPGCYFQCAGNITLGKGTFIGPNVGIITSNHNINNLDQHEDPKDVIIGEKCWIGMNSVILPGVILGNKTIVGAGSVVAKSFPEGKCVIAGNPARCIKVIGEEKKG